MKRLIAAVVLLVLVVAVNIWSSARLLRSTDELRALLTQAKAQNLAGDYASATKTLDSFTEAIEREKTVWILFVRRDLFYEIGLAASSLAPYANEETFRDFDADASRTLERIEVLRHTLLRVG